MQGVTICCESVMNHDEWCHSIVNYRNPYIGCEKIMNSRQHLEPVKFEELSLQLRQRSCVKEGNVHFANEGTFAFCLHSFWVSLWKLESEVHEYAFFIFLSLSRIS